ncbi:phosphatidylinositol transfer protein PDR16 isoform X1 [Physcomitrium patens]|uniref:CRAL-TRIO domain-containing protein n=2 Tax=Physcomitrium patens TaxID=3218 RepID=A9T773_PHYPA|nr:phosphatidylinositol transfer protein 3-like isoform X1 [Physcomitrium patens]XP_024378312.1 phosphatidylinositol transfer protein 3-like isoform X1 [Physcomitrium patens]XP_024378313.1 phosphatidylinositol transfer protein 3-like isoform X1 [Physcomitrium patens]XP_024378314.1 phosphatidylinositol transfer protein 3-like isoform X1 [Physcomitrium patens]XP_024378315.1 phosphatidylinositol transfer protein 3-like isoform X1 [Physcomitrium patens]PNR52498.1 hypothetical protein PHYPA_008872 |eukprot:XP_024378311.1 phosphatidylinositol transfer protein 3-like isoform X1 [Physcomitrella patens]
MKRLISHKDHEPTSYTEEEARVNDLRTALGPLTGRALQYATDDCLRRYLRARNWNVKKAEKMLQESLAWRASFKPDEIRWEDVAGETETGKVYRAVCKDKQGHSVLILRPAKQNTTSREGQIKQLVYMMENAILNLPSGQEEMVWLIDFHEWSLSKSIPVKTAQETAKVLQNHYPERLGIAILYNPPHYFEAFWQIVKPFLDPRTVKKVKFVYSTDAASMKLVNSLFDNSQLEELLREENFNLEEYSRQMRQDDAKFGLRRKLADERPEAA